MTDASSVRPEAGESGTPAEWARFDRMLVSDVADALYTAAIETQLAGLLPVWRARHPRATLDDDDIRFLTAPDFWQSFGAEYVTPQDIVCAYGPNGYLRRRELQRPGVTRDDEWLLEDEWLLDEIDEARSRIFCAALRPLVHALEAGVIGAFGQELPVREPDQPKKAVPYEVLDDRSWYFVRDKSSLHVLLRPGFSEPRYRRTELRLRAVSNETAEATADAVAQASTGLAPAAAPVIPDPLRARLDELVGGIFERSPEPKPGLAKVWAEVKQTPGYERTPRERVRTALDKVRPPAVGRPRSAPRNSQQNSRD